VDIIKNRPDVREKALKFGMNYPDDEELVMLILGSGTKSLPVDSMARKIISALDGSNEIDRVQRLMAVKGIGNGKALAVAAALELGKRRSCHLGAHVKTPQDLVPFVKNYAMNTKEHFLVVTLNGGHNIIHIHVVSVGTINRTLIHPREVFVSAITENAAAIILCHNHPSGNCSPSKDDIATTEMLINASAIVGIPILDHIIIDCNGYFSFLENNILFSQEK